MKKFLIYVLILGVVVLPIPQKGFTKEASKYKRLKKQIVINEKAQQGLEDNIESTETEIRKLKNKKNPTKVEREENPCDICVEEAKLCNAADAQAALQEVCIVNKRNLCKVALSPKEKVCHNVYKNKKCYDEVLSPDQRTIVDNCWKVQAELRVVELEEELQEKKAEFEEVQKRGERLHAELEEFQEDCPECVWLERQEEMADKYGGFFPGFSKPREPTTMDYVLGAIQVGTPLVLGGLQGYFGYKSAQSYANSYNSYVNGSQAMGVPFYPPNPYGGMYGAGMGGMGTSPWLYGLYGGLAGLGALAGGGLGGGIYLGGGMGGGYPMMGGGYPMMGGGFGGGYPMGAGYMMPPMGLGAIGSPFGMGYPGAGLGGGIYLGGGMGGGYPMMGGGFPMMGGGMGGGYPMGPSIFTGSIGPFWGSPMMGGGYPMMGGGYPMMGGGFPGAGLGGGIYLGGGMGGGFPMMGGGMGGGYPPPFVMPGTGFSPGPYAGGGFPMPMPGFPGMPGMGAPWGPMGGSGGMFMPPFPGGPGFFPGGPSFGGGGMYGPGMMQSWQQSQQYYQQMMQQQMQYMQQQQMYSQEMSVLQRQMSDIQMRYYQLYSSMMGGYTPQAGGGAPGGAIPPGTPQGPIPGGTGAAPGGPGVTF